MLNITNPRHRDAVLAHLGREQQRKASGRRTASVRRVETSARALPVGQRLLLLTLRADALSRHCAAHLREMHAPEPDARDRLALEGMGYVAFGKLTPSGHHAAGDVARDLMLRIEKARRGEFTLTFERGLIAGLPGLLAAQLLKLNGGFMGPAAATRIEHHCDLVDRPGADALIGWLTAAGFVGANGKLTPRGHERVQAVWRSCSSDWYGS